MNVTIKKTLTRRPQGDYPSFAVTMRDLTPGKMMAIHTALASFSRSSIVGQDVFLAFDRAMPIDKE